MDSKESVDALFEYATEGIIVVDESGVITKANKSAEKLFGYNKEDLAGNKIEMLVPRRYVHKHNEDRTRYEENPHARSMGAGRDLYGLKKDGTEFPVEISLSPYSSPNGNFVIAFIVDITIRKQSEEKLKNYSVELEKQVRNRTLILEEAIEELEKTKKELSQALDKEKELNELKSRFVSMASHEFRTPLTTMMSSLSLITKYGEHNDKINQSNHVNKIKSSINNLTDILNDFLSVSKLEEGKIQYNPAAMNLEEFIAEIVAEMKGMAHDGQEIIYEHTGGTEVILDKKILKHVLFNLISNAIKFSPEAEQVDVRSQLTDDEILISVADHGIGIPKADQKHLFERFFRGNNATHIQGTGLGLHIVGKYVELMNGHMELESEENAGTTFTIRLPLKL